MFLYRVKSSSKAVDFEYLEKMFESLHKKVEPAEEEGMPEAQIV